MAPREMRRAWMTALRQRQARPVATTSELSDLPDAGAPARRRSASCSSTPAASARSAAGSTPAGGLLRPRRPAARRPTRPSAAASPGAAPA
ncbi:MAG: hypothetical protein MZW92_23500 [Comamonadaceae bacterium]|nr:hypothetical protein [Comamonadaceae bacterium]